MRGGGGAQSLFCQSTMQVLSMRGGFGDWPYALGCVSFVLPYEKYHSLYMKKSK